MIRVSTDQQQRRVPSGFTLAFFDDLGSVELEMESTVQQDGGRSRKFEHTIRFEVVETSGDGDFAGIDEAYEDWALGAFYELRQRILSVTKGRG